MYASTRGSASYVMRWPSVDQLGSLCRLGAAPISAGASAATSPGIPAASAIASRTAFGRHVGWRWFVHGGELIGLTAWRLANAGERDLVRGAEHTAELDSADAAEDSPAHEEPVEGHADDEADEGEELRH